MSATGMTKRCESHGPYSGQCVECLKADRDNWRALAGIGKQSLLGQRDEAVALLRRARESLRELVGDTAWDAEAKAVGDNAQSVLAELDAHLAEPLEPACPHGYVASCPECSGVGRREDAKRSESG